MRTGIGLALASCLFLGTAPALAGPLAASGRTVHLQRNSVDGLASAIAAAGPGGTVLVQPGPHFESGTVAVETPVAIVGKRGATLVSLTTPTPAFILEPALHVKATGVAIQGLTMRPAEGGEGNTAIVIQDASDVQIAGNDISGYQYGVVVQNGDRAAIEGNTIATATSWQTGATSPAVGIVNINGGSVRITGNRVSNAFFGIFASDHGGRASGNTLSDSFIGMIFCKVPPGDFTIGGIGYGSASPATGWIGHGNFAARNSWGYLVIDGASGNLLSNNAASANSVYDVELAGDSLRFGFLTPTSSGNTVNAGPHSGITVKDCGVGNVVNGGTPIDVSVDPCF